MATRAGDISIVGAGLAGALLACLLARQGRRVAVYERRPDPRAAGFAGGRSINLALSVRGIHGLEQAGLADMVLRDAVRMPGRMIHSPTGQLTFQPYSKDPRDAINSVSRGGLNVTLIDGAEGAGASIRFEHRCLDVDLSRPAVTFEGPDREHVTVESDLVIAADGAYSAVRGVMQRQERFDYSQSSLDHGYKELSIPAAPGGGFAMEPGALHIWPRGGFMMIALPNRDGSFTCTLFWPFDGPNSFEAVRSDDDLRRFFLANFPDALPLMPTLADDYRQNPVGTMVTIRCSPWHHAGRVVLVGDAAHAIVPFYGQGMNAAFEDCVVLAEVLGAAGTKDITAVLDEYEERRQPHANAIADLAVHNFLEMRDHVASPLFRLKKRGERLLHRAIPFWYVPLYHMISFTRIPYATAQQRAERQSWVVRAVALLLLLLAAFFVPSCIRAFVASP